MKPPYNFAIRMFDAAARVAATYRPKVRKLVDGQRSAIDYLRSTLSPEGGYIWIHASSLGEFEQGRPLIEKLRRERPDCRILLTFFSPSGYEVRRNFPDVDAVCYLPMDIKSRVREFLDVVKPSVAIFVKYEFWGNYLMELHRRKVPTYIISAIFRKGQIFFRPWGGMFRAMLRCYDRIFVQDEASRLMLEEIGIDRVTVAGDTRFDRVTDIMRGTVEIPQAAAMTASVDSLAIVAGSTWPPDEEFLIPYFNANPAVKLIIAPHEVRDDRINAILSRLERPAVRLSTATAEESAAADCLIVDCYGKLASIYRYGRVAYVGGGFGVGIHNINEAAVYGMPVVFGSNYHKFKEAVDMIECGGAFTFTDNAAFTRIMDGLTKPMNDNELRCAAGEAAGNYIRTHLGATDRVYKDIFGASKK